MANGQREFRAPETESVADDCSQSLFSERDAAGGGARLLLAFWRRQRTKSSDDVRNPDSCGPGDDYHPQGKNDNTAVNINTQNLAKPSSLTPAENVYVVWIQPPGQDAQNHGMLRVNKNLAGDLETETPYKRFKIFITAEQNAQIQMPQGPTVLSAEVSQS